LADTEKGTDGGQNHGRENDNPYDLHKLVPDLPHKVVTGTSRWLHMDKPEEFNRILDELLEEILRDIK
jgi:pimeloyl-ACP methyl ester carboxylesterase